MSNSNYPASRLAGLKTNRAPDTNGETIAVTCKIDPDDLVALDALPGHRSAKIRQAIRNFLEETNQFT